MSLLRRGEPPSLFVVAGPNGSGKSSAYENADIETLGRSVWIVNPDLLTARIRDIENLGQEAANVAAVTRIQSWLEASINVHKTIGVETVLSTPKYRPLVTKAKELGFTIKLVYVVLDSPERNIERVKLRIKKGGHAVPDEKIRARYFRSLEQFPWFLDQADQAWIYDNSGATPKLIGEKHDGLVRLDESALPVVVSAVETIKTA